MKKTRKTTQRTTLITPFQLRPSRINSLNIHTNKTAYKKFEQLAAGISAFSIVNLSLCTIIAGGQKPYPINSFHSIVYTITMKSIQPLCPLPTPLCNFPLAHSQDEFDLFKVGGIETQCSVFKRRENKWRAIPPLKRKRSGAGACVQALSLFTFAGNAPGILSFQESIEVLPICNFQRGWTLHKLGNITTHRMLQTNWFNAIAFSSQKMLYFGATKDAHKITSYSLEKSKADQIVNVKAQNFGGRVLYNRFKRIKSSIFTLLQEGQAFKIDIENEKVRISPVKSEQIVLLNKD